MSSTKRIAALAAAAIAAAACGGNQQKAPPAVVSAVTPATGTVGTIVTIDGTAFAQSGSGASAGNPAVTFKPSSGGAAVAATVLSFSPTSLDVAVPDMGASLSAAGTALDVTVTNPGALPATSAHAFTMAAPAIADVNGGRAGSGTVNSLFILDGHAFGDLSAAPAGGYSVDFRDAASNAVVASAAVNYAGSDWQDIFIVGAVPGTLTAGVAYDLTVTTPSGTSAPVSFAVTSAVSFSPSTIQWTATSSLPSAQQGFPVALVPVGSTTFLYALGGNTASASTANGKAASVDSVSFNQLDAATGALANASWTATAPLPDKRGFAAGVAASPFNSVVAGNGALYVLGGLDGTGAATDTVYFAPVAADGSVAAAGTPGAWSATTSLPQKLFAAGAVIFHGRIYVAGGNDATGAPVSKVYSAKIGADGTLAPWQTLPDLPAAVAYHQLVNSGAFLYVLGGTTAAVDPVSNAQSASAQGAIYTNAINIRSGGLSSLTWNTNAASMGKAREKFSAVAAGSYLLVSGGLYNGASTGSSEQSYAAINADGSIASFNGATGSHTVSGATSGYDFFNHAATLFVDGSGNPHVLVVGGADTGTGVPHAGVWYQH
jgi:IPT/TIG domain-containing protein